jgi:hypothetical protein
MLALMSMDVRISVPGLSREAAIALDRRADLTGAPIAFHPPRGEGVILKTSVGPLVELIDLREDPSIGSETLGFQDGWPHDPHVRAWFAGAMRFLGESAPEGRFAFQAGWSEHFPPERTVELSLAAFLDRIQAGGLRSRERYDVRV